MSQIFMAVNIKIMKRIQKFFQLLLILFFIESLKKGVQFRIHSKENLSLVGSRKPALIYGTVVM